jgi:hypothetical protein
MGEAELQRYLDAAQDHLAARLLIVRQLSATEIEEKYREALEQPDQEQGKLIRQWGEERRRKREVKDAELAKLEERHKQALDAISVPAEAFSAAKKAFTTLAQELSPQEWLTLAVEYARQIGDSVKKIREEAKGDKPANAGAQK